MTEIVIEQYDNFNTKGCPENLSFDDFYYQPIRSTYFDFINDYDDVFDFFSFLLNLIHLPKFSQILPSVQQIVRLFVITLSNPLPDGSSISKIIINQLEISFCSQIIL